MQHPITQDAVIEADISAATQPRSTLSGTDRLRRHFLRASQPAARHRWAAAHTLTHHANKSHGLEPTSGPEQHVETTAAQQTSIAEEEKAKAVQGTNVRDTMRTMIQDTTKAAPLSSSLYYAAGMGFDIDVTAALRDEAHFSHRRRNAFLTSGTLHGKSSTNNEQPIGQAHNTDGGSNNSSEEEEDDDDESTGSCAVRLLVITRATLATLLAPVQNIVQQQQQQQQQASSREDATKKPQPQAQARRSSSVEQGAHKTRAAAWANKEEDHRPWQTREVAMKKKARTRRKTGALLRRLLREQDGFLSTLQGELMHMLCEEGYTGGDGSGSNGCDALPLLGLQLHTWPHSTSHNDDGSSNTEEKGSDVLYWSEKDKEEDTPRRHSEKQRVVCVIALAYPHIAQGNITLQLPWLHESVVCISTALREHVLGRMLRDVVQSVAQIHARSDRCHGHLEADNVFLRTNVLEAMEQIARLQEGEAAALTRLDETSHRSVVVLADGTVYGKVELAVQRAMAKQLVHKLYTSVQGNNHNNSSSLGSGTNDHTAADQAFSLKSTTEQLLAALAASQDELRVFTLTATTATPPPPECIRPEAPEKGSTDKKAVHAAPLRRTVNLTSPRCPVRAPSCDVWQLGTLAVTLAEGIVDEWCCYQDRPLIQFSPAVHDAWSGELVRFVRRCTALQAHERPSAQELLEEDAWLSKYAHYDSSEENDMSAVDTLEAYLSADAPVSYDNNSSSSSALRAIHDQEPCYMTSEALLHAFGRAVLHRCRMRNEQQEMENDYTEGAAEQSTQQQPQTVQQQQQQQQDTLSMAQSKDRSDTTHHNATSAANSMSVSRACSYMPGVTEHGSNIAEKGSASLAQTYSPQHMNTHTMNQPPFSLQATQRFMQTVQPHATSLTATSAAGAATAGIEKDALLLDCLARMEPACTQTNNDSSTTSTTTSNSGNSDAEADEEEHTTGKDVKAARDMQQPSPPLITDHTPASGGSSAFLAPLAAAVEACRAELQLQHALRSYQTNTNTLADTHVTSHNKSGSSGSSREEEASSADTQHSHTASRCELRQENTHLHARSTSRSSSSSSSSVSSLTSSSSVSTLSLTAAHEGTGQASALRRQRRAHKSSDAADMSHARSAPPRAQAATDDDHDDTAKSSYKRDAVLEEKQEALTAILQAFWNLARECPLAADVWAVCLLRHLATEARFAECMSPALYDSLQPFIVPAMGAESSSNNNSTLNAHNGAGAAAGEGDEESGTAGAGQAEGSPAVPRMAETNPVLFHQHELCKWYVAASRLLERENDESDYSVAY